MPASSSALSSSAPAGPTNGRPCRSSLSPGCSPMNITVDDDFPSPNTVCVPLFQRSQAWQPAATVLSLGSVGRDGINGSAVTPQCTAIDDPTQVNCLLKSTPSIFPRER